MAEKKDYFTDKVNGTVQAAFVLDDKGEPEFLDSEDGRRHFKVKLSLITKNPEVRTVVYKLHPTYFDPIRESNNAENDFMIETTTYGDFFFVVDVTLNSGSARQSFRLSDLLGAAKNQTPAFAAAITLIQKN